MATFKIMKIYYVIFFLNIALSSCDVTYFTDEVHSFSADKENIYDIFSGDNDNKYDVFSGDKQEFEESSCDIDEFDVFSGDDKFDVSSGDKEDEFDSFSGDKQEFEESSGDNEFDVFSGDKQEFEESSGDEENELEVSGDLNESVMSSENDTTYGIELSWSPSLLTMSGLGLFCKISS
ncbi:PREDICTED: putative uncharacterized protein DDB_G0270496 isoform X9 [Papilio xuthus]|uniref:Uncharacterized protein n=1 Tax=Papilio xuthus TaxID=66420 RepID=A0AAJ6Z1X7_PAPXU|nr:PREDICTED: putative uncharacterized protein DDB_G0270496 isoform X7 [Papilio xuthus]XP_013163404.1 PREDICTED: putative uncharacterized protein DDB_G0270496 isoform X8 [Papilio xuthus]XP_013163405.1 PREDICTED: putative uncharacterized protein DDB_G0270496 isoform X9 [Papilio xuthus]